MPAVVDVVVIGGGIAGLSALRALAPLSRACLLEREPMLAAHASGRNAAIYRSLERDATSAAFSRRTLTILDGLHARGASAFLHRTGLLLASAAAERARELFAHGRAHGVDCELCADEALYLRAPVLRGGEIRHAVWVPSGGVLDLHALHEALAAEARRAGAEIRTATAVAALVVEAGRVVAVALENGSRIATSAVVLAAGAFSDRLARDAHAGLPLRPLRRHLVQLASNAMSAADPVVWRIDDEVYFRAESGGVLASPCDEEAAPVTTDPVSDPRVLELLAQKLARSAPVLETAAVRRYWACLRTFAPDRELVVGPDPRVRGLYWLGGLGGRGMSVAPAAGELLAACIRGETPQLATAVAPARLLETAVTISA